MNRIACVVFLFLVAVSAVAAAERDTTTVEVVQVPVYVSAQGHAVRGLARDDFQLFVNGKPQPIDYFDVVDFAAAPGAEPRPDPRQRRLYMLVFDLVFASPNSVLRAQKAAAEYVDAAAPSDLFAVAAYTTRRGLEIAVPFTRDHLAVRRAISMLRDADGGDPLRLAMTHAERTEFAGGEGRFDGGIEARAGNLLVNDLLLEPLRRLAQDEVDGLAALAKRLGPLEGQKHVVLLSSGFTAKPILGGTEEFQRVSTIPQRATPIRFWGDPIVTSRMIDMHRSFNAAGVVLDAVDVEGIPGPWEARNNDALYALTRDTGGSVIDNHNDLRAALQRLTDRQRVVYLLGFHAPRTGRESNAIRVKVRRAPAGSLVTYRQSYATAVAKPSVSDGLRLADILQNDIPQAGVTVNAKVTAGARGATVIVDVPKSELAALGGGEGDVLLYIYSGPAAVAFGQKLITADRTYVAQEFELPPGRYAAKVLVRWDGSLGYARADFTVQ